MNFVNLIGHVGQDPVVRHLDSGTKCMTFSLATTEHWKSGSEKKETTTWHNIVAWRWLADLPVEKGSKVLVIGKISNRSYQDKNGETRYISEIVATHVDIIRKFAKADDNKLPGVDADPYGFANKDKDGFSLPTAPAPVQGQSDDLPF